MGKKKKKVERYEVSQTVIITKTVDEKGETFSIHGLGVDSTQGWDALVLFFQCVDRMSKVGYPHESSSP